MDTRSVHCRKTKKMFFGLVVISFFVLTGCFPEAKMPYEYPNTKWVCEEMNAWFIVDPAHDTIYYGQMIIDGKMVEVGFGVGPGKGGSIFEFSSVDTNDKLSGPKIRFWAGDVSYQEDKFVLIESKENHVFDEESFPITFIREDLDEETIREISPWDSDGNLKEQPTEETNEN